MNKVIKSHILFLFLIFGLFSTVAAMQKQQPSTIRQLMATRFVVFTQKINTGFSWIMGKINQYYQSWFTTPAPGPQTITQKSSSQKPRIQTSQKFSSWQGIQNAIYFYDKNKHYYEFTNFYETQNQFKLDGKQWKTVEQYFQAGKFSKYPQLQEKIRDFTSNKQQGPAAGRALQFAKDNSNFIRKDWYTVSIDTMLMAVRAKFKQNDFLYEKLVGTGNEILVEDSPDTFYGRGPNGKGENQLGRILMHVRDELNQKKELLYDPAKTYALSTLK